VVADAHCAVAVLFGQISSGYLPASGSGDVELFTLQVPGVSSLPEEEKLGDGPN
jgi:hypothetical protein